MRTYGRLSYSAAAGGKRWWELDAEPQVMMRAKRVFERMAKAPGLSAMLSDTNENCAELLWFLDRYPLEITPDDLRRLRRGKREFNEQILTLEKIISGHTPPRPFALELPPREYQRLAAEIYLRNTSLLVADELGLGKTVTAIASLTDPQTLPAVVVSLSGAMPKQWADEVKRFAPSLFVHVVGKRTPYELPTRDGRKPDVLIVTYHKLHGWADVLAKYCRSVIYDEAQELRRTESDKYQGAKAVSRAVNFRLGLTATPIYNYGSEMYSVLECIAPGILGTPAEFAREWCQGDQTKTAAVKNPKAFGAYLRERFIMLRRTRADVGRELPSLSKIPHAIDSDRAELEKVEGTARELAEIILGTQAGYRGEKMKAAEELSNVVRQATGIAKAPYVAEFVRMIVESGEPVVLYGWHRAVYRIWESKLADLKPVWFTGTESPKQKSEAREAFISGESKLLIMSLRGGIGIDGLQKVCATTVFGELDWSPGVHEQCVGRVHRDGQARPVMAYFLIADEGSDPVVSQVLGLKRDQVEGIRNPKNDLLERLETDGGHLQQLARQYLAKSRATA